jgi:Na+/H+-dicarboxylate symporter
MTTKILVGIGSGIALGLFLGEYASYLDVFGKVYVGLLQMTVLPYVVVSLMANIGRFSIAEARDLAKVASLVMLFLFAIGLLMLAVLPLSFPPLQTGAFFSTSLIESRQPPDFLALYIPSNPFRALSSSFVPASVLFSILLGVALTGIAKKEELIRSLDVLTEALSRMNGFIVRLTPIGVFAIAATAAGTMTLEEGGRLQAYLLAHTLGVLFLTFGVLPVAVSILTPIRYRTLLLSSRDFLLTAWATGSLFAVLPMLIESIEKILEEQGWDAAGANTTPSVLVPLAYPFPTVGKLLALVFIPFVAWFLGQPFDPERYPLFLSAGLFSSFGNLVVTIPFMLELMKLPSDFFNLFLMAGVWSARLGDLAGGMHLLAFTLLSIAALSGKLRINMQRLIVLGGVLTLVIAVVVLSTRGYLDRSFAGRFTKAETLASLHGEDETFDPEFIEAAPNPAPLLPGENRLDRIERTGVLRVGYIPDRLPFCFENDDGELVGFDVDLVHQLAVDFEVGVQFVLTGEADLVEQLNADYFDIAIGGIHDTLDRAASVIRTKPYFVAHMALLVRDHDRRRYDTLEEIRAEGSDFTLAIVEGTYHMVAARRRAPESNIEFIKAEREFFEDTTGKYSGLLTTAEGGSAWTLKHPKYSVVLPLRRRIQIDYVIPVAGDDRGLTAFLDRWIDISENDGTLDGAFAHWIRGETGSQLERRWSIGRDVLGLWN